MNEAIIIYLYLAIGNVIKAVTVFASLYMAILFLSAFIVYIKADFERIVENRGIPLERVKDSMGVLKAKMAIGIFIVVVFLGALYPSEKDIKYIIGGTAIWKTADYLADNEEAKKIPDNVLKAMNSFLEQVNEEPTN